MIATSRILATLKNSTLSGSPNNRRAAPGRRAGCTAAHSSRCVSGGSLTRSRRRTAGRSRLRPSGRSRRGLCIGLPETPAAGPAPIGANIGGRGLFSVMVSLCAASARATTDTAAPGTNQDGGASRCRPRSLRDSGSQADWRRSGGESGRLRRWRQPAGRLCHGLLRRRTAAPEAGRVLADVDHPGEIAAELGDHIRDLVKQRMFPPDAEVAADLHDQGADAAGADRLGDLRLGRQIGQRGPGR